jgi:hypothetical protein
VHRHAAVGRRPRPGWRVPSRSRSAGRCPRGGSRRRSRLPMEFAKDLPLLRGGGAPFSPGMFAPDQDGYWSYGVPLGGWTASRSWAPGSWRTALRRYFAGLITAWRRTRASRSIRALRGLQSTPSRAWGQARTSGAGSCGDRGHVRCVQDGKADRPAHRGVGVGLRGEAGGAGARLSQVLESPIWKSLRQRRDELACHRAPPR